MGPLVAELPDRDDAREWAERELDKAVYREAEPTVFDRVAKEIGDFLASLFNPQIDGGIWSPVWTMVIVALIIAAIVVAFVIWGMPRGERRTGRRSSAAVFDDDARSAAELREAARDAVRRGAWDDAVVLRFRAIARAVDERGVFHAPPGMTAQTFALAANDYFPSLAADLNAAAAVFDDVRYLRRHASEDAATRVAVLDEAMAGMRPAKSAEAAFA